MKSIIFFLFILLVASCKNSPNKTNQTEEIKSYLVEKETADGVALFDGETLDGWEVTNFGTQGPVKVSAGNIILNYGDGCTGVTYTNDFPTVNYQLSLEAKRVSGNDFFCGITFPVDTTFCSFIVGGWGGPVVGLSTIDGKDASENETQIMMSFEKDKWYKIRLQVSDQKIMAWIDEKNVLDFETADHKISIRPEVSLSCPLGIATWNTTGVLRNIRMKKL
ncbi:DUF1080 domain-containing protein [Maribellus comscasis]|uniref:DUF1080 domain-containing protein n=1 Tax=Maribellus comscasis TaxID=2681766 RepID=A0A6I6JRA6_9BACT|nr:DUF1080 domain-containing protein [Maribellus comscasis]QGY42513.1 DUF1080 domain-containing protein [Maribellus comscasis]